jgi:quercetin dioxygenase-like cupin family protein
MNYVMNGEGILAAEDREHALKQGDFALVLAGEKHQFKNPSGKQNLRIICAVPREYE